MDKTQKRIVVALGGNALQVNGETSGEAQKAAARATAKQLAELVKAGHELVIVHGNGPQVGEIVKAEELLGPDRKPPVALDTSVAMSQGEIGYWIQQAMYNELANAGVTLPVVSVVTQIVVDETDPAFSNPTKPIGSFYPDQQTAEAAASEGGFAVKEDAGRGWRRVVPSPQPLNIIEGDFIKQAASAGAIVIAAGGGGVPVVKKGAELVGIEAVIDKDAAAEKLAELVEADILLILTAVDAVTINYKQPNETPLGTVSAEELQKHMADNQFAPGSMLPKVQAVIKFVQTKPEATAIITSPEKAYDAVIGESGTHVVA